MRANVAPVATEEQLLAFGILLARSGKVIESQISGTSMGSTLPPGSRIRIRPLPVDEYRVGQTVAFVRGSTIFAHRIAYRTRQCVLTRGDNHSWCDLPVSVNAVLGVVTEWFINGEWQRFADVPEGASVQPWRIRALEVAVRAGMLIDIRLARRASSALMRLVRLRRSVTTEFLRHPEPQVVKPKARSSVEQEFLLLALRCPNVTGGWAALPAMIGQVNWQKLLAVTSRDLYPYLCSILEPFMEGWEALPEWEALRTARRLTAVDNLRLRRELARVTGALTEAGIPVLALKGIVLAFAAYGDPSLRPMTDLDLLVPQGEEENAVHVLRKLGFDYPQGFPIPRRRHLWRIALEQEVAPPLQSSESQVLVEVHTELECSEPIFPVPAGEFWSRSTTAAIGGLNVRTLCPEDTLFHICLHQARSHRFEKGLLPLLDIRVLLDSHQGWNWESIARRSLRQGCANWMYLSLEAARNFTGATVPSSFFQALPEPRDLPRLRCLVEEQILAARAGKSPPPLIPTLLAEHSWQRRAQMLYIRTKLVQRDELAQQENSAGFPKLVQAFCRQLLVTMGAKIPKYFRAWRRGQLRVGSIRRSASLIRHSNTLFALVESGGRVEVGKASDPQP